MGRSQPRQVDPAVELAAHGLRATRQRIAVLRLLRRARSHPTAAYLHRQLVKEQPHVSLKTVYDALEALVTTGLAGCVTDGGAPYRYDANTEPHYHAQCRVCGSLVDVPAKADGQIRGRTPLPEGFEVEQIRVTLVGRCPRCHDDF
ncbi:MAG: Fur family transcriptional regulator [Myxococcota bacterium]